MKTKTLKEINKMNKEELLEYTKTTHKRHFKKWRQCMNIETDIKICVDEDKNFWIGNEYAKIFLLTKEVINVILEVFE